MSRLLCRVAAVILVSLAAGREASALSGTWNVDANGLWTNILSWNPATGYPSNVGEVAAITNDIAANRIITLNHTNMYLGRLILGDRTGTSSFTITNPTANSSVLWFTNASGPGIIDKLYGGLDTVAVQVVFGRGLTVTNNTANELVFTKTLSQTGQAAGVTYASTGGLNIGRITLSGANVYQGGTTLRQVRVAANHARAFSTNAVVINSGSQVYLGAGVQISNNITASGVGWMEGTHTNVGAIRFSADSGIWGALTLAGNTRVSGYGSGAGLNGYIFGNISGAYTLEVGEDGSLNPGAIWLLGNNTYAGTVISNQGALIVGSNTASGTLGTGPVTNNGNLIIRRSNAYAINNLISGTGALTINGSGEITLTQPNTYSGITTNLAGTLVLGADNAVGTGLFDLRGGAVRAIDGNLRTVTNLLSLSLPTVMGSATTGPLLFTGIMNNGGAAKFLTINNAWTAFSGPWTNTGPIGKGGLGDLIFSNTVNSSSITSLVGRTVLGPAGQFTNAAAAVTVGSAGVLDVSAWNGAGGYVFTAGQTLRGSGAVVGNTTVYGPLQPGLSAGTLTFSNDLALSNTPLTYELADVTTVGGGVNDLIEVGGSLTLSNNNVITLIPVAGTLSTSSPYRIFNYGANLSGGPANLSIAPGLVRTDSRTFTFDTNSAGEVNLTITGWGSNLVWAGDGLTGTGRWDLATSPHWQGGAVFYHADAVTFNNSGGANPTVTVAGTLFPESILVSSDSNYVFTGSGSITGTSTRLVKEGPGFLAIANRNTYGGGTEVNGGTLVLAAGGAAGAIAGDVTVRNGATLLSLVNDSVGYASGTKINTLNLYTGNFIHAANANVSLWGETLNLQAAFLSPTGGPNSRIDFGTDGAANNVPAFINILPDANSTIFYSQYNIGGVTGGSFSVRQALLTNYVADGTAAADLLVDAKVTGNNNTWVKTGPGTIQFTGLDGTDNNGLRLQVIEGLAILAKASSPTTHAIGYGGQGLTIDGGTVQLAGTGDDQIYNSVDVQFQATQASPGVLDMNGRNEAIDGLRGTGIVRNTASATLSTLTVGQANEGGFRWDGTIEDGAGTVSVVKAGSGTLAVGGTNTYTGPTVINAGTLRIGHWGTSGALGSGDITNNALLQLARGDYGVLDVASTITGTGRVEVIGTFTNGQVSLVTLSGNNTFTGNVNITTGALRITQSGGLGVGDKVVQVSNGTGGNPSLRLDPGEFGTIDLAAGIRFNSSVPNGALFNLSGTNIVRGNWNLQSGGGDTAIISSNGFLTLAGLVRPSATDANRGLRLGGPSDGLLSGDLANNGTNYPNLRKIGTGTWTLNGTNTYTGPTWVEAGRLALGASGSISNSSSITVSNAAILDVAGTASTYGIPAAQTLAGAGAVTGSLSISGTLAPGPANLAGTLTFDNDLTLDNAKLAYHLLDPTAVGGGINDLASVANNLSLLNVSTVSISVATATNGFAPGSYRLINYGGLLTGDTNNLVMGTVQGYATSVIRQAFGFDTAPGGQVNLTVGNGLASALIWRGGGTSTWDLASAVSWNTNTERFLQFDPVLFDDEGGASNTVTMLGTLLPASVTVNSSSNYFFAGAGKISGGASLVKLGAGNLSISNAHDYSGVTIIGGGTVIVANAAALGSGAGATIVNVGGVLDVNNRDLRAEPLILSGGTLWNSGSAAQLDTFRQLTVISNSTVGGSLTGRFGVANSGSGPTPWVVISNDVTLAVDNGSFEFRTNMRITNNGVIAVGTGGYLRLHASVLSDGGTGIYTVASGGTMDFGNYGGQTTISNGVILAGGRFVGSGATPIQAGSLTIAGTGGLVQADANMSLTGPLLGSATLTKIGAGELIMNNDISGYTGAFNINTGIVRFQQSAPFDLMPLVTNSGLGTTGSIIFDTPGGVTVTGALHLGSQLRVANGVPYGQLTIQPGASVGVADFFIGEQVSRSGDVWQNGGDVLVSNQFRLGHWSTETSRYVMAGGTLNLTGVPNGTVNQGTERAGILYVGVDGSAIFTQQAGSASAHGIVVNHRGDNTGPQEFTLDGGTFTVGPSGIKTGSTDANQNYQINLGGGTLAASANWTSVLRMALTGANGPAQFDSSGYEIALTSVMYGPGGLLKKGAGTLKLSGTNTYGGNTTVDGGVLALFGNGSITGTPVISVNTGATFDVSGRAGGSYTLANGQTIKGNGAVVGNIVAADATVAPGNSAGLLTFSNNLALSASATLAIELLNGSMTPVAGVDYDQVAMAGGTIDLTANPELTVYAPYAGMYSNAQFVIVSGGYDTNSGGLFMYGASVLNDMQTFVADGHFFYIDYGAGISGNDIILTEVPEPGTLGLLGVAAALAAWRRRRMNPR